MPIYVYRREDGSTFEIQQRITEAALTVCPDTGQSVKRVITGAGLVFKGNGFYITDYARKDQKRAEETKSAASKPTKLPETKAENTKKKPSTSAKPASPKSSD